MCGIAGIVGPLNSALPTTERVDKMVQAMRHRGPDDEGVWDAPPAGNMPWRAVLGGCRLAIQDLSQAGHQPMIDPISGTGIVFNGEIYNFRELRKSLEHDGIGLRSGSDTEVILHLFLRHGPAAF